jgi:pyruvate dehydrogenase kinase 2/3/4
LSISHPNFKWNLLDNVQHGTTWYWYSRQAIEDASYVCTRTHGDAPEVIILGRTDLTFPYVSSHISYMLLELLKNSMRATVETHGTDNMPPIKIVIADGEDNEDVCTHLSIFLRVSLRKFLFFFY